MDDIDLFPKSKKRVHYTRSVQISATMFVLILYKKYIIKGALPANFGVEN